MSGIDRPTGGESDPDRVSGREDRPFPGAPADRERVSAPGAAPSMDQMRAAYARAGSIAELEAMAKADEAAAARGTRTPEPDSPGEGPTEAAGESAAPDGRPGGQDGTAVPGTDVPGDRQPEGLTQPDRELSPFSEISERRGPALEVPAPSVEGISALHERVNCYAAFEAMAEEYAAAQKESSAPGPGGALGIDGSHSFFDGARGVQDQGATEPGERDGGERVGPGTRNADTAPEPERGEETGGEKDGEGQGEDGRDQKSKDLVEVQHPVPEAETDRSAEAASEAAPDQQTDDPRLAAMEQKMDRMLAAFESMQAKLDASEERQNELKQELGDVKTENAELRQKVAELDARSKVNQGNRLDPPENGDRPAHDEAPDVTEPGERGDTQRTDDASAHAPDSEDTAVVRERMGDGISRNEVLSQQATDRSRYTEETKSVLKSAYSVLKSSGVEVPGADLILGGQETREAFEKLPEAQQRDITGMLETGSLAFSSLSPATAAAAIGLSIYMPILRDRFGDILHKWRGKD